MQGGSPGQLTESIFLLNIGATIVAQLDIDECEVFIFTLFLFINFGKL